MTKALIQKTQVCLCVADSVHLASKWTCCLTTTSAEHVFTYFYIKAQDFFGVCVWAMKKIACDCGKKRADTDSDLPKHVLYRSHRPVKQSTSSVTRQKSHNQPAGSDWLGTAGRSAKLLIHMELLFVRPMKCFIQDQQFGWHSQLFMRRSKLKQFSLSALIQPPQLHIQTKGSVSLHIFSSSVPLPVISGWKVPGAVQVLQLFSTTKLNTTIKILTNREADHRLRTDCFN